MCWSFNNVLAFPGFFRGLLDANEVDITTDMLIAAARAIADSVSPSELNATYIVPRVRDAAVAPAVAAAVRASAERSIAERTTGKRSMTERGDVSDE